MIKFLLFCVFTHIILASELQEASSPVWSSQEQAILIFYADWCSYSSLALASLNNALTNFSIPSYKIEASKNPLKFNIKTFPQIFYYYKGEQIKFEGEKTEENLHNWVRSRAEPFVTHYEQEKTQLRVQEEICANHDACLIARGIPESFLLEIAHRIDVSIFSLSGEESLVLFQNYAEKKTQFESPLDIKTVLEFIRFNLEPALLPMERKHLDKLFNQGGTALLLIRDRRNRFYDNEITSIGDQLKAKAKLMIVDVTEALGKQVQQLLKIPDRLIPSVRLIVCGAGSMNITQYNMADEFYTDNILNFFRKWELGLIKPYILSQELPKRQFDNRIVNIVQQTFEDIVIKSGKNVLVYYYAPWCTHSRESLPLIEQLAYDLRDFQDFVIGKIDSYNNEVDNSIRGYPTIRLFIAGKRDYIEFLQDRTLTQLKRFIFSHIKSSIKVEL